MANDEKKHLYDPKVQDNPLTSERLQKFVEGRLTLQELHEISASQLMAIAQLGETMIASGKLQTAQALFEGLTALNPHLASFHTVLAGIYLKQGEFEKSIEEYSRAIRRNAKDVAALANRGEIYLRLGRLEEASRDLGQAIDIEKDIPTENRSPMGKRAMVLALALRETVNEMQRQMAEGKE